LDFGQNQIEFAIVILEQSSRERDKFNEKIDSSFTKLISVAP